MTELKTLEILEFDKIQSILAGKALTPAGKELALAISPQDEDSRVERLLDETTEMVEILKFEEPFPLQRIDDVDTLLSRVSTEGTYLDPVELLKIRLFIHLSGRLKKYMKNKSSKYPLMAEHLSQLGVPQEIIDDIDHAIDKTGDVKDSASPTLRKIRIEKASTRNKVLSKLEKIVKEKSQRGTYQDDIITIRDGRYVVPIAEGDFTSESGVVHDRSKSGATLYVEPMATVELNNRLRKLDSLEEEEIIRILMAIADLIRQHLPSLQTNYRVFAAVDFIHMRGMFSMQLDGNRPSIVKEDRVKLLNARHPLLLLSVEDRKTVIPMSLSVGGKHDILVVTGPNTGGKTVALKTLGLLILMTRSGLHIPADKESEIGSILTVFADIGDEQSIELSLSTFSSHLSRIIRAILKCDKNSIVLLDEIGAGTDPKEGAALAEAVLAHILDKGAKAFVTTHYSALKTLPEKYPRIENASLAFDQKTLTPNYEFRVGLPGSSYAIEIARRLGMPEDIVADAESLVGSQERNLTNLMEKLEGQLHDSRAEKREYESRRAEAEDKRRKLNEREASLRTREERVKRKELEDARGLVEQTRKQLEQLVKEVRESRADKEKLKQVHAELRQIDESIASRQERLQPDYNAATDELNQGDAVWIDTLQASGTLLEYLDSSKSWRIQVGNLISTVEERYVSKLDDTHAKPELPSGVNYAPLDDEISPQVSVIGMTVDEALAEVDRFLDRVALSNLNLVYILHGKGTGALRRAVKQFLSSHNLVKDFRLGYVNEGSSGVTVVTLKRD